MKHDTSTPRRTKNRHDPRMKRALRAKLSNPQLSLLDALQQEGFDASETTELLQMELNDAIYRHLKRKDDIRMDRAVMERQKNPDLSLLDALREGGFQFPKGGDECEDMLDADGISLKMRKGILISRLRQRNHLPENDEHSEEEQNYTEHSHHHVPRATTSTTIATAYAGTNHEVFDPFRNMTQTPILLPHSHPTTPRSPRGLELVLPSSTDNISNEQEEKQCLLIPFPDPQLDVAHFVRSIVEDVGTCSNFLQKLLNAHFHEVRIHYGSCICSYFYSAEFNVDDETDNHMKVHHLSLSQNGNLFSASYPCSMIDPLKPIEILSNAIEYGFCAPISPDSSESHDLTPVQRSQFQSYMKKIRDGIHLYNVDFDFNGNISLVQNVTKMKLWRNRFLMKDHREGGIFADAFHGSNSSYFLNSISPCSSEEEENQQEDFKSKETRKRDQSRHLKQSKYITRDSSSEHDEHLMKKKSKSKRKRNNLGTRKHQAEKAKSSPKKLRKLTNSTTKPPASDESSENEFHLSTADQIVPVDGRETVVVGTKKKKMQSNIEKGAELQGKEAMKPKSSSKKKEKSSSKKKEKSSSTKVSSSDESSPEKEHGSSKAKNITPKEVKEGKSPSKKESSNIAKNVKEAKSSMQSPTTSESKSRKTQPKDNLDTEKQPANFLSTKEILQTVDGLGMHSTKKKLQEIARALDLKVSGIKEDLLQRIEMYTQSVKKTTDAIDQSSTVDSGNNLECTEQQPSPLLPQTNAPVSSIKKNKKNLINSVSKDDLKEKCHSYGLPVSGNKTELLQKIERFEEDNPTAKTEGIGSENKVLEEKPSPGKEKQKSHTVETAVVDEPAEKKLSSKSEGTKEKVKKSKKVHKKTKFGDVNKYADKQKKSKDNKKSKKKSKKKEKKSKRREEEMKEEDVANI